jgi:hypothetical protein
MKFLNLIVIFAILSQASAFTQSVASAQQSAQVSSSPRSIATPQSIPAADMENARKARALLEQAIQALGGPAFLNIKDRQEEGRSYSFYHGRPTSNGVLFWRFLEYPDKERIEFTPERDVANVYNGDKGYELTYKGPRPVDKKDLDDYLRRRRFSLDTMLRSWINDPGVALFYDGNALAGNLPAQQITLVNSKDEAVYVFLDLDTHLPIKKSYSWRDPADKQKNTEEEIYDNYRLVQGVMTAYGFTRYYNSDMQSERFIHAVRYNEGLNQAMFDPNSGYNPNKAAGKKPAGKH